MDIESLYTRYYRHYKRDLNPLAAVQMQRAARIAEEEQQINVVTIQSLCE